MKTLKLCRICDKKFSVYSSEIKKGNGKFCSVACYRKSQFGRKLSKITKSKISESRMGEKNWAKRPEVREKIRKFMLGRLINEKHFAWKDKKVSYSGLHKWVQRKLGRPNQCEYCGEIILSPYQIHWANKSHKYLRDLTDWIRLCVPCHRKYDANIS